MFHVFLLRVKDAAFSDITPARELVTAGLQMRITDEQSLVNSLLSWLWLNVSSREVALAFGPDGAWHTFRHFTAAKTRENVPLGFTENAEGARKLTNGRSRHFVESDR